MPLTTPRIDRFMAKVDKTDTCWLWTGGTAKGYGAFYDGTRQVPAHRWLYEYMNGVLTSVLVIDHLCENKACVNPEHLEAVSHPENCRRRYHDACDKGHAYTEDNTITYPTAKRRCKRCMQETYRRNHPTAKHLPPSLR
jgi:hypothetical protein